MQDFSQKKDMDYSESYTYHFVENISLIRLLINLSTSYNWKIYHLDVKCAYLYSKLKEEIYMKLPPGYIDHDVKVAKLLRPIYRLKQSGCNWNNKIDKFLTKNEFKKTNK